MGAYYNENDRFAAAWLRELVADGVIADGKVDERSILDVRPDDLRGFTQCHFFAGIGGWSYALRLAGWPDDREVWTGSCPCQPFSSAGKQKGTADKRHLWPTFRDLIAECKPSVVFGEQVASRLGREWLADVRAEMETLGYAVGAADIGAAGVGAPHIRQRLWWVADASDEGRQGRLSGRPNQGRQDIDRHAGCGGADFWDGEHILCADGKARIIEPSVKPLADGIPNRVGTLRGAGNAIVPQVAAVFVRAYDAA